MNYLPIHSFASFNSGLALYGGCCLATSARRKKKHTLVLTPPTTTVLRTKVPYVRNSKICVYNVADLHVHIWSVEASSSEKRGGSSQKLCAN